MNATRTLTFLWTPWSMFVSIVIVVATIVFSLLAWRRSGFRRGFGLLELLRVVLDKTDRIVVVSAADARIDDLALHPLDLGQGGSDFILLGHVERILRVLRAAWHNAFCVARPSTDRPRRGRHWLRHSDRLVAA